MLVAARLESGSSAINPFYGGHDGAAYSDAFLAMAVAVVLALIVAFRMRPAATSRDS